MRFFIVAISLLLLFGFRFAKSQQLYEGRLTTNCGNNGSSTLGYSCNGHNTSCQAYLIFRSVKPYNSVSSISTLLNADPDQISSINSVSVNASFEDNKMVIVPVNCSCSGKYYQSNTSYVVQKGDTNLFIANNTFEGLSTCQALQQQNGNGSDLILVGQTLNVPLRCACPTKSQVDADYNYLLSYLIATGDLVATIGERFGSSAKDIRDANNMTETDNIYPYTTLLVPLKEPPSSSQTDVSPSPAPPPSSYVSITPSGTHSSSKSWIYICIGVIGGVALVGLAVFFIFFRKRKMVNSQSTNVPRNTLTKEKSDKETSEVWKNLQSLTESFNVYKFEELQAATSNFDSSCRVSQSVYRGKINGDLAAIKKMSGDVSKETSLLSKINHSNIIGFSGVCFDGTHLYLIYEYAANGSLRDWIFHDRDDGKALTWNQKLQIALDVASGLNYLHNFTNPTVVHTNINSDSILLDGDLRGKIASFSMARSVQEEDRDFTLTKHILGTIGYMGPEYVENGLVSTKLDTYAFGILFLEMITGKEVAALGGEEKMTPSAVVNKALLEADESKNIVNFMDPFMEQSCPSEQAILIVRMIASSLNENPADRPSMEKICQLLNLLLTSVPEKKRSDASFHF